MKAVDFVYTTTIQYFTEFFTDKGGKILRISLGNVKKNSKAYYLQSNNLWCHAHTRESAIMKKVLHSDILSKI